MDHLVRNAPPEAVDYFAAVAVTLELNGFYEASAAAVKGLTVKVWRAPKITELPDLTPSGR